MKIIRWLLSHTFLILLIVAVIYGYMFWGNLAGEDTPAGKAISYLSSEFVAVEEFVEAVKEKQAQLSQDEASVQSSSAQQITATAEANGGEPTGSMRAGVSQIGNEPIDNETESAVRSEPVQLSQNDSVVEHFSRQPVSIGENQEDTASNSNTSAEAVGQELRSGSKSGPDVMPELKQSPEQVAGTVQAEATPTEETQTEETQSAAATQGKADSDVIATRSGAADSNTANENAASRNVASRNIEQQPVNISYSHNNQQVNQDSSGLRYDAGRAVAQSPDQLSSQQANSFSGNAPTAVASADVSAAADKSTAADTSTRQTQTSQAPISQAPISQAPTRRSMGAGHSGAFVSAELEKQLNNVDEQGRVVKESKPADVVRESWIAARKSFYQRNYELSEKNYQDVIANTKDNFDAYGELGNVYFNQGKKKQAASAYYEAAAILVRKGQVNRAKSLMGLLRHLDKAKAEELKVLIDSSAS